MRFDAQRFLAIYSGLLTAALAAIVLGGAARPARKTAFEEIDVQRINLREPDGTLRLVIASKRRFPGSPFRGKEIPRPGRTEDAGMLFMNDEGTEMGGLTFGGRRNEEGDIENHGGSLTFDAYEHDQVVQILGTETRGLIVSDRPERPIEPDILEMNRLLTMPPGEERKKLDRLIMERRKAGYYGANRLFVGRNSDHESVLDLKDAKGRTRLRLVVKPDGEAAIEFLDPEGKVVERVAPPRAG